MYEYMHPCSKPRLTDCANIPVKKMDAQQLHSRNTSNLYYTDIFANVLRSALPQQFII